MIKKFCDSCEKEITNHDPQFWYDVDITYASDTPGEAILERFPFQLELCAQCAVDMSFYLRNKKTLAKIKEHFIKFIKDTHEGRKARK